MTKKLHIAVLCGGQSTEHEISILSARNVVAGLDAEKYDVSVIYITRQGCWFLLDIKKTSAQHWPQACMDTHQANALILIPGHPTQPWALQADPSQTIQVDCVIPMLHGSLGEDGAMQGLLEVLNVPYVGANVLASTVCMEKHITKALLRFAGLPTGDWLCVRANELDQVSYDEVSKKLGKTVFVKPVSLGSSVGISKVTHAKAFDKAVREAFQYDNQVIVEKYIAGREIECSVLGNDDPVASLPGEVISSSNHEFYSYEAKYLDPAGAKTIAPADLSVQLVEQIQSIAVDAFKVLECEGMARVDFFITEAQEIFINEVNTVPGFTDISLYPKNWKASGLTYSELLDDLIRLALARHHRERLLSQVSPSKKEGEDQAPRVIE